MRQPITTLKRTPQEVADVRLSWQRPDLPFFAAGACHILAFAFLERYPHAGFTPKFINPAPGYGGTHVYVTNGTLAFDAQGYVLETELLQQHRRAYVAFDTGWHADIHAVDVPLAHFCAANNHRSPWDYPGDVWQRAQAYLAQFPAPPAASRA